MSHRSQAFSGKKKKLQLQEKRKKKKDKEEEEINSEKPKDEPLSKEVLRKYEGSDDEEGQSSAEDSS